MAQTTEGDNARFVGDGLGPRRTNDGEPSQLSFDPIKPKAGTLKAAVLELLYTLPGICRRSAVDELDCYELASRIGELRALGYAIGTRPCERHYHRQRFTEYFLER